MHSLEDTIAAIATPQGDGALGILRVSGTQAIALVHKIFKPVAHGDLLSAPSHTCHVGTLMGTEPIDHVVVSLFRAPRSYTGEDVVEISAHGSPFVLQKILALCLHQGARLAEPGEFTQRAFVAGKMDLTQAEAVAELIRAKTDKTHAAALAQLEGRLATEIRTLRDQLLPLLAHVEVGLDHSDEDHDFLSRSKLVEKGESVLQRLDVILATERTSKILREGLRVALVGRPNVGKSSLLNALLKEERAIVTPIAGTTRDTLEESVNWDGIPVILVDTAGLRTHTQDPVEKIGIERTRRSVEQADFVIGLLDASQPLTPEDRAVVDACLAKPHLWVLNKSDLPITLDRSEFHRWNGQSPLVSVSAKTGEGLLGLIELVKQQALQEKSSTAEAQWLINTRHADALRRARAAILEAIAAARGKVYEECVAMELKAAINALGEVIGEVSTEDLLGEIFKNFCIGK